MKMAKIEELKGVYLPRPQLTRLVDRKGHIFISLNMSLLVKRQSVSGRTRQGYLSPMKMKKKKPYAHPA
ncbi:hypothetical protein ACN38_g3507 [Penicillium nordicum]|uniref:Uncharacterized protein n=1 Tax=Penicillium nordicum TaxID=229535 RepID=A0A0M8P878_9EURO|nr:hypothetical protein ACN38_g3507 [Penicillium nordicum]